MKRRGWPSTLEIGVARDEHGKFLEAHAWIEHDGSVPRSTWPGAEPRALFVKLPEVSRRAARCARRLRRRGADRLAGSAVVPCVPFLRSAQRVCWHGSSELLRRCCARVCVKSGSSAVWRLPVRSPSGPPPDARRSASGAQREWRLARVEAEIRAVAQRPVWPPPCSPGRPRQQVLLFLPLPLSATLSERRRGRASIFGAGVARRGRSSLSAPSSGWCAKGAPSVRRADQRAPARTQDAPAHVAAADYDASACATGMCFSARGGLSVGPPRSRSARVAWAAATDALRGHACAGPRPPSLRDGQDRTLRMSLEALDSSTRTWSARGWSRTWFRDDLAGASPDGPFDLHALETSMEAKRSSS